MSFNPKSLHNVFAKIFQEKSLRKSLARLQQNRTQQSFNKERVQQESSKALEIKNLTMFNKQRV
jgi:hypothetical protein